MAKKKSASNRHQSKNEEQIQQPPQNLDPISPTTTIPTMADDGQSEKLNSLKSLNSILLKETHERRLQVDALLQTNTDLKSQLNVAESALTRVTAEKSDMESRIDGLAFQLGQVTGERNGLREEFAGFKSEMAKLKSEGEFQIGVLEKKVHELNGHVERERAVSAGVLTERDGLKDELEVQIKEFAGLKKEIAQVKSEGECQIAVLEKKVGELTGDVGRERAVSGRVLRERDELEMRIKEVSALRETVEKKMTDETRKLKTSYEGLLRKNTETLSAIQTLNKDKESVEAKLEETVRNNDDLKREMAKLKSEDEYQIAVLEKKVHELNGHVERERAVSSQVLCERDGLKEKLEVQIKEFAGLKKEIAQVKNEGECQIAVLEKKVGELTGDVERERAVSGRVLHERDELEMRIKEVSALRENAERKMADETRKLKTSYEGSLRKNMEMLSAIQTLTKDKESVEAKLEEIVRSNDDLKREMAKLKSEDEYQIAVLEKKVDELTGHVENERAVSSQVLCERDVLKEKLEVQIKEVSVSRENAMEMENAARKMADETQKLKTSYEGSLRKNMEVISAMQTLTKEKESINAKLAETARRNDDLKRELEEAKQVSETIEEEKNRQAMSIHVLEKKVDELTGDVETEKVVLSRVLGERDELKEQLGVQIKEVSVLREKNAAEMEKAERKMADETRQLKTSYERKNTEMISAMQALTKEKEAIDAQLVDTVRSNDDLKRELEQVARVNEKIQEERNSQDREIQVLEKKVNELNGTVKGLKDIEEALHRKISGLEMSNSEGVETRKQLLSEFNILQGQKAEFEEKTEILLEEKTASIRLSEALEKKLDDQKLHIEGLVQDKSDLEEDRNKQVVKIKELEKQLGDLGEVVTTLRGAELALNAKVHESAKHIETLLGEKSANLTSLELLEKKLEAQSRSLEAMIRDKKEVEEERKMEASKIKELEKQLRENASTLHEVETELNSKISEMQNSMVEVNKKKNFWTLFTSATLFAAASVAYVSRGN